VGLERGPLNLVNTAEDLLWRNSSISGMKTREYGHRDPQCWPRDTIYPQKLALTSPTSYGRSVVIVRSQTKPTELLLIVFLRIGLTNWYLTLVPLYQTTRGIFSDESNFHGYHREELRWYAFNRKCSEAGFLHWRVQRRNKLRQEWRVILSVAR
jgi:hypothetical protein